MVPETAFVYLRHDDVALTLLGVAVVIVVGTVAGRLFERISQPPVIGEVLAGIALGPTVLGHWSNGLFPAHSRPLLGVLAGFGLVVFMFLVGLEMDLELLDRGHRRTALVVSVWGTVLPFALGLLLALPLHPSHHDKRLLPFALFLGAAMSITAFPVLARILQERGLYDTPLGVLAMAAAAGDDVLTWATLALVVAIVASSGAWAFPWIVTLTVAFAVVMVTAVRPLLARLAGRQPSLAVVVAGVLASAFATSAIGIHAIFGPFLLGALFPRGAWAADLRARLDPVAAVLLPVFFVSTGLNVDIGTVGLQGLWQLGLILVVACAGKLVGATVGARTQGLAWRESVAMGALMNTRGLTELVVLDVGRQLGVLDGPLFTVLVVMAVLTTLATAPVVAAIRPDPWLGRGGVGPPDHR